MQYQWDHDCRAFIRPGEKQLEIVQARQCYSHPENCAKDSASAEFWLDHFQNTLHSLLEGYLNGASLSLSDRLLLRPMQSPKGSTQELLNRAWHLVTQKLQTDGVTDGQREFQSVPIQLVELFQILDQQLSETGCNSSEVVVHPSKANPNNEPRQLTKIRQLVTERLQQTNTQLLVQGSVATDEQIGYSDLDLWLVVSREALSQADRLQELAKLIFSVQRFLFEFDPLQHHGVMLATQIDLPRYSEAYLPMDALAKARYVCPGNGGPLITRPRSSALETGMTFFNLLALFRQSVQQNSKYEEAFAVKSILSHTMLLPAFFEGAQGRPCFKGDSFARVKSHVPADTWSIMEEVSEVRQNWRYQPSLARKAVQKSLKNPFLFQYLLRHGLSGKLEKVVKTQLPKNWQARTLALAEYLWGRLCK